jgi:hypothetical protein
MNELVDALNGEGRLFLLLAALMSFDLFLF